MTTATQRYNSNNQCLNCGESFYEPHQPTCVWSDDYSLNMIKCGDCLRSDCNGCI